MNRLSCNRGAVTAALILLSGCGGSQPAIGTRASSSARLTAPRTHPNIAYAVVYSFKGGSADGAAPSAPLVEINGALYGTSYAGGGTGCAFGRGCGTVFEVTTSGVETVLHNFAGGSDGANPVAGLTDVTGTLYGTTYSGDSEDNGVVYRIGTGGVERVLHAFNGGSADGQYPSAGLLDVKGTLYGTTTSGGGDGCDGRGCGTVYSINKRGDEKIVHSFLGSHRDGQDPRAPLIRVNGMLYGTTEGGGAVNGVLRGTIFSITTDGTERVLHTFKKGSVDGQTPDAGLVNVNGTLYGTTKIGGTEGDGTVYSISQSGKEKVLFSFHGYDGHYPAASLIEVNGTLYGTTSHGGSGGCKLGCGTVFSITTQGEENVVVHNFGSTSNDGLYPKASLIDVNGTLYGTTYGGGAYGDGTVFALTP
jgi:uncharacterized repeat protein (TIGR03803 family)